MTYSSICCVAFANVVTDLFSSFFIVVYCFLWLPIWRLKFCILLLLFGCSDEMSMSTTPMTSSSAALPLLPVAMEVCAGCRLPIEDRFLLRVMDNSWHERCLQCSACCEPLRHSCFVKDRRLLCRRDYDK